MPSDLVLKTMNAVHRGLLKVSGGRLGWNASHMPVLELTTTGRKSGQPRTVMLTSPVQEGSTVVVVASRGGDDQHPAWFLNLRDNPDVEVVLQGKPKQRMHARDRDTRRAGTPVAPRHRRPQELRGLPDQDDARDPAGAPRTRLVVCPRVRVSATPGSSGRGSGQASLSSARVVSSSGVWNVAWNRFTWFDSPTTKQSSTICGASKWRVSDS